MVESNTSALVVRDDNPSNDKSRKYKQGQKKGSGSFFKGLTSEMNGHVFQVHSEQSKKGQFEDTMTALEIYASKIYKADMIHLTIFFKDLKAPILMEPIPPEGKKIT